ncbi:sugar-binding domain-containing protein [Chelativorans sp. AA-79]|uniref:sugar-binding transcriptional regulator n=1 Tax=Chelativorans sp. AA-79 TaxID=3028735 RepID=UPI0023F9F810|nr:sugar-binding domain-containing protein [Chelativorans sp. AA-79]WEX10604.1 sugar-binding domain-containing protein [Chelativorans sp. AA-79]
MLYTVAKLHYESDMSQVDIARRLNVSTATISRLLQRARAEGIVRIEVRDPVAPGALADRLAEKLGLARTAVVETPINDPLPALTDPLAQMLLDSGLRAGSVVAIGWGRAVRSVVEVGLPRIPGVHVVPATGGMQQHQAHFQVNEFVRSAADRLGGVPHFIHAPYLPAHEARQAFLSDPAIRDSVALWDRIDVAVVGVGLPHAMNSPEASAATPGEQALVDAAGDVVRHYFDADGRLIDWDGERRMIAVSPEQLRRARLVIGVAAGAEKAAAITGAARAGLISALVTDTRAAEAILDRL